MGTFLMYLTGFSILAYALLMLLGAVLGDAVWFIAALLAGGGCGRSAGLRVGKAGPGRAKVGQAAGGEREGELTVGKIKGTILETILTGLTALALVFLAVIFAGMTRQSLVFLLLFLLVAVLAGLVGYLLWKVHYLEERLDKLLEKKESE